MAHRLGRPKTGQETLTRERIITTALEIVDERGVDGLSMRRLAAELGVDAMAIYHYLPNKRAILAGLVEIAFNELRVPTAQNTSWQEQVRAFARAYREVAQAHPNLVLYVVSDAESGASAALSANEYLYQALATAGLTSRMIVRVADLVVDYLNGFALAESSGRLGQPGERQEFLTRLGQHPPEQFPTIRRVFGDLVEEDMLADFEAGLDVILAGAEAIIRPTDPQNAE